MHRVTDFGFNAFLLGSRAAFYHAIRRLAKMRRKYETNLGFWVFGINGPENRVKK